MVRWEVGLGGAYRGATYYGHNMVDGIDQRLWAAGDTQDREEGDDNGIADQGGLGEAWYGTDEPLGAIDGGSGL